MAVKCCEPLSLLCSRFMAKHTCSSLPSQWQRTHLGCSAAMHFRALMGNRVRIPVDPSSNLKSNSPRSVKVVCMRGRETSVVTGDSWDESILNSDIPILVEFFAPWCGPCRMVHRVIEEVAKEYTGRLKCYILNTDQDLQVADKYGIDSVPVVLLFKNGEKQHSLVGTLHKETYVAAIEKLLAS